MAIPLNPSEGRRLYGGDASGYAAGRPDYPPRVYEILRDRGLAPRSRVLEIGPGPGLVTARLLAAGARVTAVEANANMAAHLRRAFPGGDLTVVTSSFEETRLPKGSFDLVVAATSFHWVAQPAGWANLLGALRPGAQAAIWWMLFQDPHNPDAFDQASHELLGGDPSLPRQPGGTPFQIDTVARKAEFHAAGLVDVDSEIVRATYSLDAAQIEALYATTAIVLRRTAEDQERVLDKLGQLVEDAGGRLERTFVTAIYWGVKPR